MDTTVYLNEALNFITHVVKVKNSDQGSKFVYDHFCGNGITKRYLFNFLSLNESSKRPKKNKKDNKHPDE